jgi:hypothetical protein
MTEAEWLACTNLNRMVSYLRETQVKVSERQLRLFACANCRRIWRLLQHDQTRFAVETAESYSDAMTSESELTAIRLSIANMDSRLFVYGKERACTTAIEALIIAPTHFRNIFQLVRAADKARNAVADNAIDSEDDRFDTKGSWGRVRAAERKSQCVVLRDIIGNPFRPIKPDPHWLAWNDGAISKVAAAAYDERELPSGHLDKQRLAVLGDMLEEAGCRDTELLSHLRRPDAAHVRGCFVVDLLLGKE